MVFIHNQVKALFQQLSGVKWTMANLLYGSGLRISECLRLRVKDIDFEYNQINVRNSKRNKDRVTMLPAILKEPLQKQIEKVKRLHLENLRKGFGAVALPCALAKKYPNAGKELG